MPVNFNQWLIDLAGRTSTTPRSYDQHVDYVLHVEDQVPRPGPNPGEDHRLPLGGHGLRGHRAHTGSVGGEGRGDGFRPPLIWGLLRHDGGADPGWDPPRTVRTA